MFGFFKKKEKPIVLPPLDAKLIGADIHSHLIPGIDDGATSLEDSLALVKGLQNFGFTSFYTTPHVMLDFYNNSSEKIKCGTEDLNHYLKQQNISAEIKPSAEYYFDENFIKRVETNDLLPIANEFILFEFSYINEPENPFPLIHKIKDLGYKPLLAHPERYPFYYGREEGLKKLREHGVYFQINLNSLAGHYGPAVHQMADWLIDENLVDFVGTDIHKKSHLDVIERALRSEKLLRLVESGRLMNQGLK